MAPGQIALLLPVDLIDQLPDSINGSSYILLFAVLTVHVASLPPLAFDDAPLSLNGVESAAVWREKLLIEVCFPLASNS